MPERALASMPCAQRARMRRRSLRAAWGLRGYRHGILRKIMKKTHRCRRCILVVGSRRSSLMRINVFDAQDSLPASASMFSLHVALAEPTKNKIHVTNHTSFDRKITALRKAKVPERLRKYFESLFFCVFLARALSLSLGLTVFLPQNLRNAKKFSYAKAHPKV